MNLNCWIWSLIKPFSVTRLLQCSYLEWIVSSPCHHTCLCQNRFNIMLPSKPRNFQTAPVFQAFWQRRYEMWSPHFLLGASSISFIFIWSFNKTSGGYNLLISSLFAFTASFRFFLHVESKCYSQPSAFTRCRSGLKCCRYDSCIISWLWHCAVW
jgi:hypothetical protein